MQRFLLLSLTLATIAFPDVTCLATQTQLGGVVYSGTLNAIGEGRRDFLKWNCYSCHGPFGAGGIGPNIQRKGNASVREAIQFGGSDGYMPSFLAYAKNQDIINLSAYLASIGSSSEPKWFDWWVAVPAK